MPEACFLCLDSTEFTRNGDQFPNRFLAMQEAANLLVNAKIQMNAENTVGFLSLGGNACTVFETLTQDVDRVMASLTKIRISGKQCHFSKGLQIACLALSHRTNPRAERRIVAFIGTPLTETDEELDILARKLRKDDVSVDVVGIGVESNVPRLAAFVEKLSKRGNSHFLNVSVSTNLTDSLMSSPIFLGSDAVESAAEGHNEFQGFGIDPSTDPELAMAIRMSLEEEQQRQAAVAAAAAAAAASDANRGANATSTPQAEAENLENLSEEEMLARALQMSLEEAQKASRGPEESNPTTHPEEDAFAREVENELKNEQESKDTSGNTNDKESKKGGDGDKK
ncbi:proteasome regulatory non-ATPase subunit [Trypanosoma theileri]|uniref:Proteasome regulatory non-ATPase subunit n=1 Tax=Trypanosoma theileri TaxID=67003 RepID=A0A1X0NPW3_9TRYP|nr:proteasome regulatory non-ATPase subunit [Trypanosoma theileri]ORC86641.1 proteasome regulatory non-ATPase subunit [Trypanosoma theileri]